MAGVPVTTLGSCQVLATRPRICVETWVEVYVIETNSSDCFLVGMGSVLLLALHLAMETEPVGGGPCPHSFYRSVLVPSSTFLGACYPHASLGPQRSFFQLGEP